MRYVLRDKQILRWVMDHPGRGTPFSTRTLGAEVGCHHSQIGHLLTGERVDVASDLAESIAEAVGVMPLVLFAPSSSPNQNGAALKPQTAIQKPA